MSRVTTCCPKRPRRQPGHVGAPGEIPRQVGPSGDPVMPARFRSALPLGTAGVWARVIRCCYARGSRRSARRASARSPHPVSHFGFIVLGILCSTATAVRLEAVRKSLLPPSSPSPLLPGPIPCVLRLTHRPHCPGIRLWASQTSSLMGNSHPAKISAAYPGLPPFTVSSFSYQQVKPLICDAITLTF